VGDGVEVGLGVPGQVGALGEVLAQQHDGGLSPVAEVFVSNALHA
jgi:hypothetical protein